MYTAFLLKLRKDENGNNDKRLINKQTNMIRVES